MRTFAGRSRGESPTRQVALPSRVGALQRRETESSPHGPHTIGTQRNGIAHFAKDMSRVPVSSARPVEVSPWLECSLEGIQCKLAVSAPGDRFELEADATAEQVTRLRAPMAQRHLKSGADAPTPSDAVPLQIQRIANGGGTGTAQTGSDLASGLGAGVPLDTASRAYFEPRFGHDFGNVRIHDGSRANMVAANIRARAFTLGGDVAFAVGEHDPVSERGKRLLAHELTHVVQQSAAAPGRATPKMGSSPGAVLQVRRTTSNAAQSKVRVRTARTLKKNW